MTKLFRSRAAPWLLVALCLLSLAGVTRRLAASDEIEYFAWLPSWSFDHDVDFRNEYQHFYDAAPARLGGLHATFLELTNEAGRAPNFTPIGTALLWLPFYAIGHLVAWLTGAPRDGFSAPYITAVTWGSALYGFAAIWLTWRIVQHLIGRGAWTTWAVAVGTPLVFYMYVAPGFSHAASAFVVSLFVWTWLRVRGSWNAAGLAVLAAIGAFLPMVREQDACFLAGPALDFLATLRSQPAADRVRHLRGVIIAAAVFLCVYAPQLLAYRALNGHFGPTRLVTRKMTWSSPHLVGVLFSPEHGFIMWTPLALVACAGLIALALGRVKTVHRDARWIGVLLVVLLFLQAYISGCVESWTVAGSFGQRRFVAVTPILAVGLAALIPAVRGWRTYAVTTIIAVCIWWNLGLMAQFGLHLMDRQRLTPAENARLTFLQLPAAMPSIVWRYVTDRDSFYGLPRQ